MSYCRMLVLLVCQLGLSNQISASEAPAGDLDSRLLLASPGEISADAALQQHMSTLAERAIGEHCAACHGSNLEGSTGVPNLVDYDWIWGVTGLEVNDVGPVMEIMQTILYGVRDTDCPEETKRYGGCPDTRYSEMPAYGSIGFTDQQVSDLTELMIANSGRDADAQAVARAGSLWPVCTECHGEDGYGDKIFGGPDLMDDVWLYGGSREQIYDVIYNGRLGTCPNWSRTLDPATIKALAVYIYQKAMG